MTVACSSLPSHLTENISESAAPFMAPLTSVTTAQARTPASPDWPAVEQAILAEQNRVRQNPQSYLPILEQYLASMNADGNIPNGCGRNCTLLTNEGKSAVEEAIAFLRTQAPLPALTYSLEVAQVAKGHAQDQRDGSVGHNGSDGRSPAERLSSIENFGTGENIAYGPTTAQSVVMNLIVDDGVADRGHRTTIFSPNWTATGAGCGEHETIRTVCVINYVKAPKATASGSRFAVTNNGTVELLSLMSGGVELLDRSLSPGQSQEIALGESLACETTLTIQLGGNYQPLDWEGLYLCDSKMTIDGENKFKVQY